VAFMAAAIERHSHRSPSGVQVHGGSLFDPNGGRGRASVKPLADDEEAEAEAVWFCVGTTSSTRSKACVGDASDKATSNVATRATSAMLALGRRDVVVLMMVMVMMVLLDPGEEEEGGMWMNGWTRHVQRAGEGDEASGGGAAWCLSEGHSSATERLTRPPSAESYGIGIMIYITSATGRVSHMRACVRVCVCRDWIARGRGRDIERERVALLQLPARVVTLTEGIQLGHGALFRRSIVKVHHHVWLLLPHHLDLLERLATAEHELVHDEQVVDAYVRAHINQPTNEPHVQSIEHSMGEVVDERRGAFSLLLPRNFSNSWRTRARTVRSENGSS